MLLAPSGRSLRREEVAVRRQFADVERIGKEGGPLPVEPQEAVTYAARTDKTHLGSGCATQK